MPSAMPNLFMRMQALFDSWDCTVPPLPKRSRLYALKPLGIGTPFVESLSGYVARLADAHAVSLGNFVGRELSALVANPLVHSFRGETGLDPHGFHARTYAINSFGEAAKRWVEALQTGTMQDDLRFLTLLPFEHLLCPLAIFRHCRAWCATCYEDSRSRGNIVHESLLWTLKMVTFCPRHRQPLDEVCPHCSRRAKPLTVYSRPGYCSSCQEWLGRHAPEGGQSTFKQHDAEASLWYAGAIGDLLAAAPRVDPTSLRRTFTANFRACVDLIAEGNKSAFADAAGLTSDTVDSLMTGKRLPSIPTLLRVSYRLKIPVIGFLEREPAAAEAHWQEARGRVEKRRLPSSHAPEAIRAALQRATSEQPPPRLSDIAQRFNYLKLDRLYRVDPKLCRQIASRYQDSVRGHWRTPSDKRFCSASKMKRALEASLAQELPTAAYYVALDLGFVGEITLKRKFPDLCRRIQERIDEHNALNIASMGRALKAALQEEPPPSLSQLCERLGCCRAVILRRHFSALCDQLLERRRAYRVHQIEILKRRLQELSLESPAVSLEKACKRVGLSRQRLVTLCPDESTAIVAHYESSLRGRTMQRTAELDRQVREIVGKLHEEGKFPSVKRVRACLEGSAVHGWTTVNAMIRAAISELNTRATDPR
jgi:transcriptional regulator with XRE-family HTH domain